MGKLVVINEVHSVAFRIQAWMFKSLGYEVKAAGGTFGKIFPLYHPSHQDRPDLYSGMLEVKDTPPDALLVDTHPDSERKLRERGMPNPLLLVWQMPVGPEWVRANFKPGKNVGSMGWSNSVGREISRMGCCPCDTFWPPYQEMLDTTPRGAFQEHVVTVIENAAGWSNIEVLERLRKDPSFKLELYGGGPPDWSRRIPQPDLWARMRSATAMYHRKPFDTPGLAVMEALLMGLPVLFPPDWLRTTDSGDILSHDESCVVVETDLAAVKAAVDRLRDPGENRRVGLEGRRKALDHADWTKNKPRFQKLVDDICAGAGASPRPAPAPAAPAPAPAAPAPAPAPSPAARMTPEQAHSFALKVVSSPDGRPDWLRPLVDEEINVTQYYRFIYEHMRAFKPARVVELGTFRGNSAAHFSAGNPGATVVTVDVDPGAKARVEALGLKNVVALTGDSLQSFESVKGILPEIDVLLVDTAHQFPHAFHEYALYRDLVRDGGLILLDDIHINPDMDRVWSLVVDPKVEANFLHYKGFGIAIKDQSRKP